jgi:hypothetical protein
MNYMNFNKRGFIQERDFFLRKIYFYLEDNF